jgi:VWFA-related protein
MRFVALAIVAPLAALQPSFRTAVDLVTVPVTVTNNGRDRFITGGLSAKDFRVIEDGIDQTITQFSSQRVPVSLCVVLDSSGSMVEASKIDVGRRTLMHLVAGLAPEDEVSLVDFADVVSVLVPWTRDRDFERLIEQWTARKDAQTSLSDAMVRALEMMDSAANPRRAIMLLSDGFENASATPVHAAVTSRRRSEAVVYAVGLQGPPPQLPGPTGSTIFDRSSPTARGGQDVRPLGVLPDLVGDSGGILMPVLTTADGVAAAASLLNELRYQYTIGYMPSRPLDGKYRRIKVEPTRGGIRVRHRGGYLALPSSP